MILSIVKLPSQVLRRPVEDITFPLSKQVLRLFKDMLDTVKHANGVGLAAPQVGKGLNAALIYLEQANIPPFIIINPKIKKSSRETSIMEEGCLSLPGLFGEVKRPKKITIEAYDLSGKLFTITDDTFLARVLQHEIDHLSNTLIIDKLGKVSEGKDLIKKYNDK
jgi:peptide deformylase